MGLKQDSKVLALAQGEPDKDVKIVVKNNIAEFRRVNNDSLLLVMTGEDCLGLAQEFFTIPNAQDIYRINV